MSELTRTAHEGLTTIQPIFFLFHQLDWKCSQTLETVNTTNGTIHLILTLTVNCVNTLLYGKISMLSTERKPTRKANALVDSQSKQETVTFVLFSHSLVTMKVSHEARKRFST